MFNYNKIVILDIEGNSVKATNELKITQFSAIIIENGKQREVNYFNRNVNLIPPVVQKITHLSISKLKKEGMTQRRMIDKIYEDIHDADIIYAYGYQFDKKIIRLMFDKYGYQSKLTWVDVQDLVKERLKLNFLKLSRVADYLGFEETHFHDSLIDCHAILYILEYLDATNPINSNEVLNK